jgi:hypothetical protein
MSRKKTASDETLPITVRYDGPTDVLDVTPDRVKIERGNTGHVSVEMAQHLLGCDYADVTVVDGDVPAEWPTSHRKLDLLADRLGVDWPEPSNGQQPLSVEGKAAALEQAGYLPDGTQKTPSGSSDPKENE